MAWKKGTQPGAHRMQTRDIVVIGASAGGMEALRTLVADLPATFPAAIFIVWHLGEQSLGLLPDVLSNAGRLTAFNAVDGESIEQGRIYVAPPNFHLLVGQGVVQVKKGPRENRFRPAVDPLFRSAALAYGPRVIGAILTGYLDDGTAGLWTIKRFGGIAVVQDPQDADFPSMPASAIRSVAVDHIVTLREMAVLLQRLVAEPAMETPSTDMEERKRLEIEVSIAGEATPTSDTELGIGEVSPLACPECHGVLFKIVEGNRTRFRCHTGHAYSADALLAEVTEKVEDTLWNTIRGMNESVFLLRHMGIHLANSGDTQLAKKYLEHAEQVERHIAQVRGVISQHERFTAGTVEGKTLPTLTLPDKS